MIGINTLSKPDYYYQVWLEVSLAGSEYVFGFINISHIPYAKFEELFIEQITRERFLFDDSIGYNINNALYNKHKDYLDKEIAFKFDFKLFEYWVSMSGDKRERYKKDYYDELPPLLG